MVGLKPRRSPRLLVEPLSCTDKHLPPSRFRSTAPVVKNLGCAPGTDLWNVSKGSIPEGRRTRQPSFGHVAAKADYKA